MRRGGTHKEKKRAEKTDERADSWVACSLLILGTEAASNAEDEASGSFTYATNLASRAAKEKVDS